MFTTFAISSSAPKQARSCDACRSLKIKASVDEHDQLQAAGGSADLILTSAEIHGQRLTAIRAINVDLRENRDGPDTLKFGKLVDLKSDSKPKKPQPAEVISKEETLPSEQPNTLASHAPLETSIGITTLRPFLEGPDLLGESQLLPDHGYPIDTRSQLILNNSFPGIETQSSLDVWATVHEFFDTMYLVLPIISYVEVVSSLIMEPNWATSPHLRTLIYALRLGIAAANYRLNSYNELEVQSLVFEVEASRCTYGFADPPTLDAVVCSLILFAACNVLRTQNRAFLYLSEASFLLQAFVPTSEIEEQRRLRLEKVLFNTESATFPIYATRGFKRRARRPSPKWESYPPQQNVLGNNVMSDKLAAHLLRRLTQVHLAEDAKQLNDINIDSEASLKTQFGSEIFNQHRYARIQSTDVVVTRQWRLSCQLVASRGSSPKTREAAGSDVESLGTVAMSWLCLLEAGDLRIVGLGKLVGLAFNIYMLGGRTRFRDHLHALVSLVMGEDHEGEFSLALADLTLPMYCTIPPQIDPQDGGMAYRAEQNISTDLQTTSETVDWSEHSIESNTSIQPGGTEWMNVGHGCGWDGTVATSIPWVSMEELTYTTLQKDAR